MPARIGELGVSGVQGIDRRSACEQDELRALQSLDRMLESPERGQYRATPAEREPEPPPVEATLTRVDYDLRIDGELASGRASLTVDVLALNEEVLGFTNIWYEPALKHAFTVTLSGGHPIRVITAPFFLGTKMEAFQGRGKMDLQASHDLEDFVAVIEGRDALLQEIAASPQSLRRYLADAAKMLLAESRFLDALPGFVLDDERVPLIKGRLATIAANIP